MIFDIITLFGCGVGVGFFSLVEVVEVEEERGRSLFEREVEIAEF